MSDSPFPLEPTAAQAQELQALRLKLKRLAAVIAWHLLGAAALMSFQRLAAAF